METIKKRCENCGKNIYIQEERVRDKMFCTLGCMDKYQKSNGCQLPPPEGGVF